MKVSTRVTTENNGFSAIAARSGITPNVRSNATTTSLSETLLSQMRLPTSASPAQNMLKLISQLNRPRGHHLLMNMTKKKMFKCKTSLMLHQTQRPLKKKKLKRTLRPSPLKIKKCLPSLWRATMRQLSK